MKSVLLRSHLFSTLERAVHKPSKLNEVDLAVAIGIVASGQSCDLMLIQFEAGFPEELLELSVGEPAVLVVIESSEDFSDLYGLALEHSFELLLDEIDVGMWEELRVAFHELQSRLIGLQELEEMPVDHQSGPDVELIWLEPTVRSWVLHLRSLQEFTTQESAIPLILLVHRNLVVGEVECDDETAIHILHRRVLELGQESQLAVRMIVELLVVLLGNLRHKE
mmetsp:Transcript_9983/g.19166  ORF Transcript_9983/g.19166 Transcript_9983/m.19166 type:complete len:223 (-) Transcript_9983:494-1162(-)